MYSGFIIYPVSCTQEYSREENEVYVMNLLGVST